MVPQRKVSSISVLVRSIAPTVTAASTCFSLAPNGKLTVFTSLDYARIVADGNRRGVRVLKEFLEYASHGAFTPGRQSGEEPDSDFERWFLSRLKSASYEAHPQVGVAKYRIDIGVIHPDKPGSYILGVECDGATYHSSKSARDRDRLRQDVLEGLNWGFTGCGRPIGTAIPNAN